MKKILKRFLPGCIKRKIAEVLSSYENTNRDLYLWINKLNIKNPRIIDAGANDGTDSLYFAKRFPAGEIYAFEPVSRVYKYLKRKTKRYKNIKIFKMGLSDKDGIAQMNVSSYSDDSYIPGSSSFLKPASTHKKKFPDVEFKNTEMCNMIKLDSLKDIGIEFADVLRLDMQGYEPIVISASKEFIKRVKIIYTEVSTKENYQGAILYEGYKNLLKKKGFSLVKETIDHNVGMGDALFVREHLI